MDRLQAEIRAQGMTVFARIDHAAGAEEVGLTLPPTELIIFGNARGGTPLMQSSQTAGIDLPLKALVWQDTAGKTWLSNNEPGWIAQRHSVANAEQVVSKMAAALSAISRKAADSQWQRNWVWLPKQKRPKWPGNFLPDCVIWGQGGLDESENICVEADGVTVFYREAGAADAPVVLLLHGFPTSSFQYRELIPRLGWPVSSHPPDLPWFGFTEVSEKRHYSYSFDALAQTVLAFTDALGLKRYALYVFDYGAPTGFRLAMARPERVAAIVSQNGNAYEEGLGDAWAPIQR
jgi:uncharacterized protein (DUF302 family)